MQKGQRGPADSSHVGGLTGLLPTLGSSQSEHQAQVGSAETLRLGRGWATRATGKVRGLGAALWAPGENDPGNKPQKGLSVQLF